VTRKKLTCILCPNGCELEVSHSGEPTPDSIVVEGHTCPRGIDYAIEELTAPKRTLTTSILVSGGTQPQASVKTACPIPREALFAARGELRSVVIDAPVALGEVVATNIAGTGVDVVVTRAVGRKLNDTSRPER